MFQPSSEVVAREIVPGFLGQFFHGNSVTLAHWNVAAGSQLPQHSHLHEQMTTVISGQFEMTIEGEIQTLHAGDVAIILANQVHSGRALTDCHLVDAFSPVREDYK